MANRNDVAAYLIALGESTTPGNWTRGKAQDLIARAKPTGKGSTPGRPGKLGEAGCIVFTDPPTPKPNRVATPPGPVAIACGTLGDAGAAAVGSVLGSVLGPMLSGLGRLGAVGVIAIVVCWLFAAAQVVAAAAAAVLSVVIAVTTVALVAAVVGVVVVPVASVAYDGVDWSYIGVWRQARADNRARAAAQRAEMDRRRAQLRAACRADRSIATPHRTSLAIEAAPLVVTEPVAQAAQDHVEHWTTGPSRTVRQEVRGGS